MRSDKKCSIENYSELFFLPSHQKHGQNQELFPLKRIKKEISLFKDQDFSSWFDQCCLIFLDFSRTSERVHKIDQMDL